MAQIGSLFRTVQQLVRELDPSRFQELPSPPAPVRLEVDEDGEFTVGLLVTLAAEEAASRERALANLAEQGFHQTTSTGRVAAGYAKVDDLDALEKVDGDLVIEAAHAVYPELDVSVPEAWNRPSGWSGSAPRGGNVVIGIVDLGIDVTHPSFRTAAGTTRIITLWDQTIRGAAPPPANHRYGSEWDSAAIDAYLTSVAGARFPAKAESHGTAVAGVAASNGRGAPAGQYVGVAPDADLVVVTLNAPRGAFASTDNVLNALAYVFDTADALGKRAVVNLSQGAQLGPHDPNGQLELGITDLLARDENRVVVTSMGNIGNADAHARLDIPSDDSIDLEVDVPSLVGPYVMIELWYDAADQLAIELLDPSGSTGPVVESDELGSGLLGSDIYEIRWTPVFRGVQANQLLVTLRTVSHLGDVTPGVWTIRLHGRYRTSGEPVHAWLERGLVASPRFRPPHIDSDCTVTQPSTADEVLPVSSYSLSPILGRFTDVSSRGPDRRGRALQGLAAPGGPVTSCNADPSYSTTTHATYSGTSYAAAHVTGAIALLLQAEPALTRKQVFDCLLQNARADSDTAAGPATGWGAGKLDIWAALRSATSLRG